MTMMKEVGKIFLFYLKLDLQISKCIIFSFFQRLPLKSNRLMGASSACNDYIHRLSRKEAVIFYLVSWKNLSSYAEIRVKENDVYVASAHLLFSNVHTSWACT